MSRGPDFLVIGAMKCATSTLHAQLARQPGVFMSELKEPNFFSDDEIYGRGVDWYLELFDDASPGDVCGESSTHYTKLPTYPSTVERAREHLGEHAKLIYVMRQPVDRLVSHYVHEWTQGRLSGSIDGASLECKELVDYGRYAMQLRPWIETFGSEQVLPVFFDSLRTRPQWELERIGRFLGIPSRPRWQDGEPRYNVSRDRLRRSRLRDALADNPCMRWMRRTLVPRVVRDRVKDLWRMSERPVLSDRCQEELKAEFDEDLRELGLWLGARLSCDTFVEVSQVLEPAWRRAPEKVVG